MGFEMSKNAQNHSLMDEILKVVFPPWPLAKKLEGLKDNAQEAARYAGAAIIAMLTGGGGLHALNMPKAPQPEKPEQNTQQQKNTRSHG